MAVLLIIILLYMKEFMSRHLLSQELKNLKFVIAQTSETLERIKIIDEIHNDINKKLEDSFKDDEYIKVDTEKQELILDDSILFGVNEWALKEVGQEKLRKILPGFFANFIDDETILSYLESLTIEGHTDDLGNINKQRNYLYNLDLSQKRAYEVVKFIYNDEHIIKTLGENRLQKLRIHLSSNGKSNANLIYKKSGVVDREKSRRVTIKYKLDVQRLLTTPLKDLRKYQGSVK